MKKEWIHIEALPKNHVFKVPDGYFENMVSEVAAKAQPALSLAALKKEYVFTVPQNYFESLPDIIDKRIKPGFILEGIEKINPVQVPEGYFDELPQIIQSRIQKKKEQGVLQQLWEGATALSLPQYAMALAACFVLALGLRFGYLWLSAPACSDYLCNIDKADIVDYVKQNTDEHSEAVLETAGYSKTDIAEKMLQEIEKPAAEEIDYADLDDVYTD